MTFCTENRRDLDITPTIIIQSKLIELSKKIPTIVLKYASFSAMLTNNRFAKACLVILCLLC